MGGRPTLRAASSPIRSLAVLAIALPMGLTAVGMTAVGMTPAALAAPAQPGACTAPMQGRYAVMTMGTVKEQLRTSPTASLRQERWLPGGVISGELTERVGRSSRSATYQGTVTLVGTCLVRLERQLPWGRQVSEAVLDGKGRPLYSLDRGAGTVITGRWLPMAPGSCKAADLNGTVLSSQVGMNGQNGGWTPNAVVQREQWRDGSVQGVALASNNGVGETVGYSGRLTLDANGCWGNLTERDTKGVAYNYRALIVKGRAGARGYFYLQSAPADLTVGWLVRD